MPEPPFDPPPSATPSWLHQRGRMAHDRSIQMLALLGGLPAVATALTLLWHGDHSLKIRLTFSLLAVACWAACAVVARERVTYPLQTLTNLLAALREGDYSLRARRARREDVLGEVLREINTLSENMLAQRRASTEATALLRAVISEIDAAIFTFDDAGRLRLVNRAGAQLLGRPAESLLRQTAGELGLAASLEGENNRVLAAGFPTRPSGRWNVRRADFREAGRPHRLLVLSDVSQPLREEERAAWQRLIRVLGHELNNSLAPIQSIADSLGSLLARPEERRPADWRQDLAAGLEIIAGRSEALGRFMASYALLARLPAPSLQRQPIGPLARRVAGLETRLRIALEPGPEIELDFDRDQIEQLLINLIRNAADAALEVPGRAPGAACVWVCWEILPADPERGEDRRLALIVEDNGPGLASAANLFVPFFTTKPQGSGIGLALSRQIAEAHGGALTLENRPGGQPGCRACLKLPAPARPTETLSK